MKIQSLFLKISARNSRRAKYVTIEGKRIAANGKPGAVENGARIFKMTEAEFQAAITSGQFIAFDATATVLNGQSRQRG